MVTAYMLDTSIVVEILGGRADHVLARLDHEQDLSVSTITIMELDYGVERSSRSQAMRHDRDGLLGLLQIRDFDRAAARHAGIIRAILAEKGTPISPLDTLIAGHARSLGLTVVTHNLREFSRVPDLHVEDWLATA